jgi:hypothetical protein
MLDGDRFIAEQLQAQLGADEAIVHTAYLETDSGSGVMGGLRKQAYWAALTPERLFLIKARVGAFKPMLENKGVEVIERASISGVAQQGAALILALADGRRFAFIAERKPKHASGQAGLIDEIVTQHGGTPMTVTIAKDARAKQALGLLVGVLVIGYYGYQYFYGGRAEVSVQCGSDLAGIQCTATHLSGGSSAKACWKVELRCKNGRRIAAPACTEVEVGKTSTVTIAEQKLSGLESCDEAVGLDVTGIKLE